MLAIDLLGFTSLALVVGLVIGYRIGKARGAADGDARCRDSEHRMKEMQSQVKQLLGVNDDS
ncbi:hypothetical protein [Allorhodopirellula heiligendammensis]|uniref:Uncharacterized protein n=1 Tax=Allorhodopirellula heiligendammensis TaxID=2714739 RepID=A0A5C6BWQ1_9BACT|nr:hypothetical protein [Allorhodopirellula heiligendammensis]TWU15214.1 hypothetical protein Poly21_24080 [Allorhodopirellula heiligendammensis]